MMMHRRNMLKTIAAPALLAAPALILPSRRAFSVCALQPPPLPPGAAPGFPGFGISRNLIWDDFLSLSTIDSTNTLAPGFNWYLDNTKSWQGADHSAYRPSQYGIDYTVGGSNFNIVANTGSPGSGLQFISYGFVATPSPHWVTSMPLLSGSKPFYIECRALFDSGNYTAFWIQDQATLLRSIVNSADTGIGAEFDIIEENVGTNNQTQHIWLSSTNGPNVISAPVPGVGTVGTYGLLVVPAAYNSGAGLAQFYHNRTPSVTAVGWVTDDFGVELSNYVILLAGSNNEIAHYDYVGVWTIP